MVESGGFLTSAIDRYRLPLHLPYRNRLTIQPRKEKKVMSDGSWERAAIERLLLAQVAEQRARRRWTIFFRFLWLALLLMGAVMLWNGSSRLAVDPGASHTAVVRVDGTIDLDGQASAARINHALRMAFDDPRAKGIILHVNSPGGSPVQAAMIYAEIMRLRAESPDKPVHAVIEEIGASGGYYVAAAAEQIHVNPASLVGSIGVIMEGFGVSELMGKLGVERRTLASGRDKAFLDPFAPSDPSQIEHAQRLLEDIHAQFVEAVRQGRGKRLAEDQRLFSGRIWTGRQSVELGLADAIGTVNSVARDVIAAPELVDYTLEDSWGERLVRRLGAAFGASAGEQALKVLSPSLR
jgi:protease-4